MQNVYKWIFLKPYLAKVDFFSQAGWRENPATFLEELKSLQATSLSGLGPALKESFNLLNLHRLQSGIDNYGMVSDA